MTSSKARDGSPICSHNSVLLHSAYNPVKEAQRFVSALESAFTPACVVITEPALSYTAQALRQRFPGAKLFAVRYCRDFDASDALWDGVFYNDNSSLKTALYNALGEEGLFSTLFCAWPPSTRAFPNEDAAAWRNIQDAVRLGRDVLATRTKFASRWVLNAFSMAVRLNNAATLQSGTAPIVVAASGASLMASLPLLKERRGEYFLIALSSALSPLRYAGLECGLCLTTDGGFYAGSHLASYGRGCCAPLAVAAEGNCPPAVLEKAAVVPLVYPDGPASRMVRLCMPHAVEAERNGTVSGTALRLAQHLTTGNIYFCGLDMAGGHGRQHCPPNELEVLKAARDSRLRTKEGRVTASRFGSSSLEIYRQWFASLDGDETRRVFRLSSAGTPSEVGEHPLEARQGQNCNGYLADVYPYSNTLGGIHDVGFDHFYDCLDKCSGSLLPRVVPCPVPSREERREIARDFVKNTSGTDEWLREIFPADCISLERAAGTDEKAKRHAALQEKNAALIKKIHRILDAHAGTGHD